MIAANNFKSNLNADDGEDQRKQKLKDAFMQILQKELRKTYKVPYAVSIGF